MNGNGHVLLAVQHQVGQQIVVPYPHDLQDRDRDHGGAEHRQHHAEVGAQRAAAIDGGGFLNIKRDALDKTGEHKDGKSRTEAEIDDRDGPGSIELEGIRRFGEGEHHHLERDDHREYAGKVNDAAEQRVDTGNVPGRHGGEKQDKGGGKQRDDQPDIRGPV